MMNQKKASAFNQTIMKTAQEQDIDDDSLLFSFLTCLISLAKHKGIDKERLKKSIDMTWNHIK